jgi:DNA-binding transcriptional regulator PaaX
MMSSKMAAARATLDFFEMIKKIITGEKIIFKPYHQMKFNISRSGYHKKLKKFEKFGLIIRKKTSSGNIYELSPKAKSLRSKTVTKRPRTDGFSTLIIFDIPEDKHNARDNLRRYLIRNGYIQIQKSCFLSPFRISKDLKELFNELKVKDHVSIFSVKRDFL